MSARDRETAEALARAAAALDGAVLGLGTAALAVASWVKYLAASGALRRIAAAPAVSIPDLRSLLVGEDGESRLAAVRGLVSAAPRGKVLLPAGSGEHCVVAKHTQTVPFVLVDSGFRNSTGMVHVKLDGATQPLPLTTVYYKLVPVQPTPYTFFQTIIGNGYPIALLDEEKMLPIGKEITAVGLCRVNKGSVEISSSPEIPFFLSELTKDEMEVELDSRAKTFFWASVVLGTMTVCLLGYAIYRRRERVKDRRAAREAQEQFLQAEDDEHGSSDGEIGDGQLCAICLRRRKNAAFIPCGHLVCCCPCAKKVEENPEPLCPMCRQDIRFMLRIYDS